jgi:hypothetical protein
MSRLAPAKTDRKINFRHRIALLDNRIARLKDQRKALVRKAKKGCKHKDVIEAPCHDNGMAEPYYGYSGITPSFRVCRTCGLGEEGWTFYVLAPNTYSGIPSLPRDDANKLVLAWVKDDEDDE